MGGGTEQELGQNQSHWECEEKVELHWWEAVGLLLRPSSLGLGGIYTAFHIFEKKRLVRKFFGEGGTEKLGVNLQSSVPAQQIALGFV